MHSGVSLQLIAGGNETIDWLERDGGIYMYSVSSMSKCCSHVCPHVISFYTTTNMIYTAPEIKTSTIVWRLHLAFCSAAPFFLIITWFDQIF